MAPQKLPGRINMKCDPSDKKRWGKFAKREGFKNLSHWIRHLLNLASQ